MENVLDYILDGLEAALELERELGVRSVECDRSLLGDRVSGVTGTDRVLGADRVMGSDGVTDGSKDSKDAKDPSSSSPIKQSANQGNQTIADLVFLHDRPLSAKGVEMMAKIITALGQTSETAPIIVVPPVPKKAKVLVVLGGRALKLYFPALKGEPGQWIKLPTGEDVLITYSPEYILRFGTVTPAVQKLKQDMWRSLKAVKQRLVLGA